MYCKSCGKRIDDDSSFCTYCGTKNTPIEEPLDHQIKTKNFHPLKSNLKKEEPRKQLRKPYNKYDPSYKPDGSYTIAGFALCGVWFLLFLFSKWLQAANYFDISTYVMAILTLGLISRIVVAIYSYEHARMLNRAAASWAFWAFIFPELTLIILGTRKKLAD